MRFGIVHRVMTDTLAVLGLLSLLTSGELDRGIAILILVALGFALVVPDRIQDKPLYRKLGVAAPLALLAVQTARLLGGESLLASAIEFAAGLQVLRLATRRGAAHDQQVIVLALLHLIAGLDAADGGEIRLADASVCELNDAGRAELRRDRLGLVFQQFNLIPSLTVEDNLVFQSRIAGRHDPDWHREMVERLGLGRFLKRYPEQLSGGQQQRVAIGRALAVKPLLLLADEPTGNLDEDTADEVLALARDLVARSGCGFLMVTHSERLAATLDRKVHLHAGMIA